MKKLRPLYLSSLVFLSGHLYGDDGRWIEEAPIATIAMPNANADQTPQKPPPQLPPSGVPFNFPLNADQNSYSKISLLYWKTYQDDLDYGNRLTTSTPGNPDYEIKFRPEKPGFDWNTGVRVGLGFYLPKHDLWDLSFFFTYFYANAPDQSTPSPEKGSILTQLLEPDDQITGSDNAKANWEMNLFIGDLSLGRQFILIPTITVRPFLGIRGVMIDQTYSCRYRRLRVESITFQELKVQRFKSDNDYSGIGPRLGTDFSFFLSKRWTLLANFSSSLFIGSYRVREKIRALTFDFEEFSSESSYRLKDRGYTIRYNIEGSVGLGWEHWMNKHSVRFAPSILFEGSEWFDVNQLSQIPNATDYNLADAFPYQNTYRLHGDLGLLGFTINLQLDY